MRTLTIVALSCVLLAPSHAAAHHGVDVFLGGGINSPETTVGLNVRFAK